MRAKLRYDNHTRAILNELGLTYRNKTLRFDGPHADAGESLFLIQELQAIEAKIAEQPLGPLDALNLIPLDESVPAGAREWGFDRITGYGIAQWVAADGKDLTRVEVKRERVTFPVKTMAAMYSFTREDLEAAAMANMPLDATLASEARRSIDSFKDKVWIEGDASVGMTGFLNDANVSIGSLAHGKWDGTAATPDQIIAEINGYVFAVMRTTKKAFIPDTLVVPTGVYGYITTAPRSAQSDMTIWEFIRKNNPFLKNLEMLLQSDTVANGGVGPGVSGVSRAVLYKRAPEVLTAKQAIGFDILPPVIAGFSMDTACRARIGGTCFRVPIAAVYLDGVS